MGLVRGNPYAAVVCLDNRVANRQAHSHPVRFLGEERVEYPVDVVRTDSCSGVRHRYFYAAAGVNISVPIFDGMLFSAREREAQLRARATEENLREAENNVIRDVRIAGLNLSYAAERLTLTAQLLESANESFELAQARYKVGSSSIVELSQAQLNQTEAEIAQAKAKYEYQTRNSVLNFQLGQTP